MDITSEYNLPIDFNHSFDLAEIMRELTKMSDEDFSLIVTQISRQNLQEDTRNDSAVEI